MLLAKVGRHDEAIHALTAATNVKIKDYDLANRLNTRIQGNLRRIRKAQTDGP